MRDERRICRRLRIWSAEDVWTSRKNLHASWPRSREEGKNDKVSSFNVY